MIYFSDFESGGGGTGPSSGGPVTWNEFDCHVEINLPGVDNLTADKLTSDALRSVRATFGRDAATDNGYFEVYNGDNGGGTADQSPFRLYGVSTSSLSLASYCGSDTNSWGYYEDDGAKVFNTVQTAYGASYRTGDTVGVAFKNGKLWFSKNGVWTGNPAAGTGEAFSGITGTIYPTASLFRASVPAHKSIFRGSAVNCVYSPPSGFLNWER